MQNQLQGLDFSDAETYVCENCGHDHFEVTYLIKRFSALISPTGQEMLTPIQAFACKECGHINKDFLPENETL
jgi:predicted RNA-binding Zn-ribbon protein involved in translation (DUF1610 family)